LDLTTLGYQEIKNKLAAGETTCQELTQNFLENIDKGAQLNAFISIFRDRSLEAAAEVDQKIATGQAGKLAGMVMGIKDIIVIKGQRTTCGSKILSNFISPYDATVIQKLRAEDAVFIGKTNLDEFAMGSSSENSAFGPVRNPRDPNRVPGGSSGGSAAAVGADMCTTALGSDTGGSIRQPASFSGVVGLKPTYGRVSRFGLVAYASSLDQIGPFAKTVADAALLLEVIAGHDANDSTSANLPVPSYQQSLGKDVKGLSIGLPREYFSSALDSEVADSIQKSIDLLRQAGAEIVEISLPHTEYAIAAYYIIATAEASSNLARYDGARYGVRDENARDLEEMYNLSRTKGFGEEVKRRIMLGTYVLSSGYYEAYYRKAQKVRTLIKRDFEQAFQKVDCLLTPTAPTTAFSLGEKVDDPLTMYLSDIFTVSLNLAGLPGLSLPCGTDSRGLPIGLQLIGKPFDESTIFRVADFVEKNLTI